MTAGLFAAGATPATCAATAIVNPDKSWVTWEGWGCSLCWWANQFGQRDDLAEVLFTNHTTRLTSSVGPYTLPGLGFNIARYNIGGTSSAPAFGEHASIPASLPPFKQIQGYWLDWGSADPASASFDWSADANQRAMLLKARDRGADRLEAFSNAPMWWMCYNHSTAGSDSGGDNLQSWNYETFARYLATVTRYAHDHWGVDFETVEPFNEPAAGWWKYPGGQESCHFDTSTQMQVIAFLRSQLDGLGLQNVGISASDENSVDSALNTWNALAGSTRNRIARVNTHGYSGLSAYRGPNRSVLYQAVSSGAKPLWMTEYGESDGTGLTMAQSILLDINETHATGWVYWQPLDSGGWGLIQSNPGDNWIGPANARYYVLAQFSRHIRPGMAILDSGDPGSVAAYDPTGHTLVIVTVNGPTGRWMSYDLSRFRSAAGPVTRWTTAADGSALYVRGADTALNGLAFRSWLAPNTVQTFEVRNVFLNATAVWQVNAGGPAVGPVAADAGFAGGAVSSTNALIDAGASQAVPPAAYSSERYGDFRYVASGLTPGADMEVRLHFAEIHFIEAGRRLFNVCINGARVLTDFDVFTEAGGANKAVVRSFPARAGNNGIITIDFSRGALDQPTVSAIEVWSRMQYITRPYTLSDLIRAASIADGITFTTGEDLARFDLVGGLSLGKIDLSDATLVARKVAGLEPNP
ncbi:MAG TPA: malectin domain-containing carbohydrate-binding protein [Armatimonadota bacterium]|jgi:galactan endo-1,6-beta-galactosidase